MISLHADDKILERSVLRPLDLKVRQDKISGIPCIKTASLVSDARNESGYEIPFYRAVNELSALGIKKMAVSVSVVYPGKFSAASPSVDFDDENTERQVADSLKRIKKLCEENNFVLKDVELSIYKGEILADGNVSTNGNSKTVAVTAVEILDLNDSVALDKQVKSEALDKQVKDCEKNMAGLDIVMTKSIAMSGALLSSKEWLLKGKHFPWNSEYVNKFSEYENYLSVIKESEIAAEHGAKLLIPINDGGITGALWKMSLLGKCGLDIDGNKIYVSQDIIELCEFFDASPYEMMGDGSILIATENGEELKEKLLKEGIKAEVIGSTNASADKIITFFGNKRFITKSRGDEMRILEL